METTPVHKNIHIRIAVKEDLPAIVQLLADDPLGSQREAADKTDLESYQLAFTEIQADPNNELLVVELDQQVSGTLQIIFIPSLTFQGGRRAQIEGVRIDRGLRGKGIGHLMVEWAIERARQRGCRIVQLTTNKQRPEALRFYMEMGLIDSHEGLKLYF